MSSTQETPSAAPVTIVPLSGKRLDSAREVFASSHAEYPAWRHVFPDPRQRQRALSVFFAATVRDAFPFGAVDAAVANDEVLGIAMWLPPGRFPGARRASSGLPRRCWVCCVPRQPASGSSLGWRERRGLHPTYPHWNLETLGIRHEAQGRGIGTRLMAPGLARADQAGLPCYLTTAKRENLAFYERFGFEVADAALPLVPNGPTAWGMRRPPITGED